MEYLPIHIEYQSKTPLVEQITERLRALIRGGILRQGDPLPTVRQLAFQLGVNFNTVARAYRALDAEGLIITWQGRGTFVEEQSHGKQEIEGTVSAETFVEAILQQAAELDISETEIFEVLQQRTKPTEGKPRTSKCRVTAKRAAAGENQPELRKIGGISLRRSRHENYHRKHRSSSKLNNVSRGT